MSSVGEPNYSGYDNATLYQTFTSGMIVQTPCFININATPPLASDLKPVDAEAFQGPEVSRYILYNGVEYTDYIVQGPVDGVSE